MLGQECLLYQTVTRTEGVVLEGVAGGGDRGLLVLGSPYDRRVSKGECGDVDV